MLEDAGIETLEFAARWGNNRIRVTEKDFKVHQELFRRLIEDARHLRDE